ncbi:protein-serine/threonine phosphatase [Yokenella regensburgei]|jgi:serine/threonine protein phosphatase 1|uniref:Serine/threonine-protein phosphatase 1 n=1 Tax=Yokenella regensburgei TaxID=158877 RepID=A0AB38G0J2_9ENTR|nr:protein-serine/threonine phosphatase [Yokenella regensburgei]KFD21315.1 Ren family protein [Yokenella regensburgei ATCC 49455]MDQ4428294.1 protein-serine/threonine phosphatase [Yokenella regensburgei]SQA65213.1 Serine/threonine-protein phosphatase 1 [Yokenella regensburgei]SQA66446.1 Serine/threonine-protein phosphatase 1 [Yokenella regensburgei]SUQ05064.1 Serine/threonine-protein phosphatase 1 [Yokenella regensburgei]
MYQRILGQHWRHIWLVGDLHGCHHLLMTKLKLLKFHPYEDLIISVGDLIDRGSESFRCLSLLPHPWFRAIRGNHEQMALDALDNNDMSLWFSNGGYWYQQLTYEEQLKVKTLFQLCRELPYIIELQCENEVHIIAHADYPATVYVWHQPVDREQVLWNRERLAAHLAGRHQPIRGADHFWFGHTPLNARYDIENQHYIDTGAVFGGELTLVQLQ